MIKAEVRLYFTTRTDYDTEFFQATSNTDMQSKAEKIAKDRHADHFNCSVATTEDEYRHSGPARRNRTSTVNDPKEQVDNIKSFLGLETSGSNRRT